MALLLKKSIDAYNYINDDVSDPRTRDSYIILNPFIMFTFCTLFYKFIYVWGPSFMDKREPYNLKRIIMVYNITQILISIYIFVKSVNVYLSGYYNIICQPICMDDTPMEREINYLVKLYYMVKIYDLMDTVFFVFTKKWSHITFLHVYHHLSMILLGFISHKYYQAGHGGLLGTINAGVHAVMYSYYLLSSINVNKENILWWKKHITQLQLIQFLILTIHFGHVLFQPSCDYPKWICLLLVAQNIFMLAMFSDFYIKSYMKKKKRID